MKKVLLAAIACLILTSCSFEAYQCPAYKNHQIQKYGNYSPMKYQKKRV